MAMPTSSEVIVLVAERVLRRVEALPSKYFSYASAPSRSTRTLVTFGNVPARTAASISERRAVATEGVCAAAIDDNAARTNAATILMVAIYAPDRVGFQTVTRM